MKIRGQAFSFAATGGTALSLEVSFSGGPKAGPRAAQGGGELAGFGEDSLDVLQGSQCPSRY